MLKVHGRPLPFQECLKFQYYWICSNIEDWVVFADHQMSIHYSRLKGGCSLFKTKMKQLEQEAHRAAGETFLITSNSQLRAVCTCVCVYLYVKRPYLLILPVHASENHQMILVLKSHFSPLELACVYVHQTYVCIFLLNGFVDINDERCSEGPFREAASPRAVWEQKAPQDAQQTAVDIRSCGTV